MNYLSKFEHKYKIGDFVEFKVSGKIRIAAVMEILCLFTTDGNISVEYYLNNQESSYGSRFKEEYIVGKATLPKTTRKNKGE